MTMTETETATASLSAITAATVGRCLVHVGTVASKDMARGVLYGIHVDTSTDADTGIRSLTFTATDSYRLIHVAVPLSDEDMVTSFDPFVIDAKQAAKVGKLITKKNAANGVSFVVGQHGPGFVFSLLTSDGSGNVDVLTGTFPAFDKLLVTENTGDLPRMDADLLSGLLSAMSGVITVSKDVAAHVDIETVDSRKPMRLSAVSDLARVVAVIMPVRK